MPGQKTALSPGLLKLLREKSYCQIATLMPDGSPQITEVWVDTDGEHILINTSASRQKTRNVRRDPRVAVNVMDPQNDHRLADIRGRVIDITTEGADDLIDRLAQKYIGQDKYPWRSPTEQRVTLVIQPEHINESGLSS